MMRCLHIRHVTNDRTLCSYTWLMHMYTGIARAMPFLCIYCYLVVFVLIVPVCHTNTVTDLYMTFIVGYNVCINTDVHPRSKYSTIYLIVHNLGRIYKRTVLAVYPLVNELSPSLSRHQHVCCHRKRSVLQT